MSYSVYAFLMLIFFVLAPFYLFSRIVDYTGYVFIGAIKKGKKEWNWFPKIDKERYGLLFFVAIISMIIGIIPIKYVNWDSLSDYYAYPIFYILIASILFLIYFFEKRSPYSVADSLRAKLDHKNLLEVRKNNSLALIENEKVQPSIYIENLKIESNHSLYKNYFKNITKEGDTFNLNVKNTSKNYTQNITKEGDTHNKTVNKIYYGKERVTKKLPFKIHEHLKNSSPETLLNTAKKLGLSKKSEDSFRMMIEDGCYPQEPLLFTNSRGIVRGVPEVNKEAVVEFYLFFFELTTDGNKGWVLGLEGSRKFILENSKFCPDNIEDNKSINEEISISNPSLSRAKKKFCKNQKA